MIPQVFNGDNLLMIHAVLTNVNNKYVNMGVLPHLRVRVMLRRVSTIPGNPGNAGNLLETAN